MNPNQLLRLMGIRNQFEQDHPKFFAFITNLLRTGVGADDVIDITITRADGTKTVTNMKVRQSDVALMQELKEMFSQRQG